MRASVHENVTRKREHLITLHLRILERSSGELSHLGNIWMSLKTSKINWFHQVSNEHLQRKPMQGNYWFQKHISYSRMSFEGFDKIKAIKRVQLEKACRKIFWSLQLNYLWAWPAYGTEHLRLKPKQARERWQWRSWCLPRFYITKNTSHRFSTSDIPMHSWRNWSYPVLIQFHIVWMLTKS